MLRLPQFIGRKRHNGLWAVKDSNLRRHAPADLQSAPFGHLGNRPGILARRLKAARDAFQPIELVGS